MSDDASIVQQVLAAMRAGDTDAARPLVADDFVWHIPGDSPIAGDVSGIDAWGEKLRRLVGAGLRSEVQDVLSGNGNVAVLQRNTAEAVGGHALDVRVLNLFSVADGKVRRMETFFSDQAAVDRFWTSALNADAS